MNENAAWHTDDEFWSELAPFMFDQDAWENAPAQVSQALELMEVDAGSYFLDLACGPGRHLLELARRGFQVTGLDRTTQYLEQANRRADSEQLEIEFVQEDMRLFSRPDSYNAAWSMFTSFGYFERPEDNQQVLLNVFRSLKEGGVFLIEMVGREVIARIFQPRDWRELDGTFLLEDRHVESNWTIMRNRRILIKDNEQTVFMITHWLYSGAELADMLRQSGFRSVDLFGNLKGSPYDQTANRLVAVARK